ncbi:uroporphyrinogen-III C-methyltransferase [Castellaniella sp.]|uniref:uroporphyrinogen-III C-methyltransferase n=1 Tax=Castellaniella sp. TaxID=1955812 RepID=UPI002AFEEFDC|nr:uroporphyrinogen-III C-methyltransferase [Castellaniella sp.]
MSEINHSQPSNSSESGTLPAPRRSAARMLWLVPLLLALVLAAALFEQNRQYQVLQTDFQRQSSENIQQIQSARQQASQALAQVREQSAEILSLRNALDATSGQLNDLDQALQLMTDSGTDLLLLNDIDHLVTIAQQQLALGGNVANAIISLEAAQAQLARANRPSLAALQQSINGDLDRLRAVATINLPALSAQIDQLSDLLGVAPLLIADRPSQANAGSTSVALASGPSPQPAEAAAQSADQPEWQRLAQDSWQWVQNGAVQLALDLRSLLEVRRVDDAAALLMSPDQAQQFREGLKQRAITAQLALMMHQSRIWKAELARISQAIAQRYDMQEETSRQALNLARALHDTPIETTLPSVDNSLAAIAAAREAEANTPETAATVSGSVDSAAPGSKSSASDAPQTPSGTDAD